MKITRNDDGIMVVSFVYDTNVEGFAINNPSRGEVFTAFQKPLLASMIRRQKACEANLAKHAGDSVLTANGNVIAWKREGGTYGYFNIPSWEVIKDTVRLLETGKISAILNDRRMVDQIIKAIMNDPKFDRSEQVHNNIKIPFSMLVSTLVDQFAQLIYE